MYARDREDARDLLQETLINLWNGLPRFRADSSVRTWVTRIAINTGISFKRKKKLHTTSESEICLPEMIDDTDAQSSQINIVHRRLQKLDYLDRAIVLLWLENLSYEEIGAIVGASAKNIGVKLVRIKNKLKEMTDHD